MLEVLVRRHRAVLCLSVHGSASEVNRSGGDTQVVSCHCYLVAFHPSVEQLTTFHTSGLVLASSSILRVLNLDLHATVAMDKPVYFNHKPIMDRHTNTNIQAQPQTKAPLALTVPAQLRASHSGIRQKKKYIYIYIYI